MILTSSMPSIVKTKIMQCALFFFMMLFYCLKINSIMFIYKSSFNLNMPFFIYEKKIICGGKNQNKLKMNTTCDAGNLYKVLE